MAVRRSWEVFYSFFAGFNYPKLPAAIGRRCCWRNWLSDKSRIDQVANRPNPIRDAKRHCWRAVQSFMHVA
jgi:hypothetical protein